MMYPSPSILIPLQSGVEPFRVMTTLHRSFIGSANPATALLLLLISILTWSSCSLASPFSQPDTTPATELTQLLGAGEIQNTAKGSDGVAAGTLTTVTTTGTCKAILPDGRLQTVVYTCAPTGYSAVVQFHKAENQSATHERNQTNANAPANATTQQQQPLQPITEILFLRPTTTDSSARLTTTTTTTESPSITTSSAAIPPTTKKPESMVAIVPPHRFHIESDQIRKVSLVQHSLPSLPLSTSSTTTPATKRHRSTTVSAAVKDESPVATTTPATTTGRRRKTRLNIAAGAIQSEPSLV
ncbi:cell wall protein DAN4-like [Daphnia pulex]|uniref:cell wall protein DAN4-like n=1 Tax=Daphnia pulex TaxID=6669 RepID=UPI001EDE543B|nr:cell wall protein DAN4-like [Daphnia pulex]